MSEFSDLHDVDRPLPVERSYAKPFWDASRERRLLVQYDREADAYQFYPRPVSIYTGKRSTLEWREVSGRGTLFSHTIIHRGPGTFRGHEPYVLAMVTLDVGVNAMGNLVNCRRDQLRVGLAVRACWAPLDDGRYLLMFEPDA